MSEIPEAIRATAVRIYSQYTSDRGSWSLVDLIAEALMAERERCAKIADKHDFGNSDQECFNAQCIAAAIRSPDTGPST